MESYLDFLSVGRTEFALTEVSLTGDSGQSIQGLLELRFPVTIEFTMHLKNFAPSVGDL